MSEKESAPVGASPRVLRQVTALTRWAGTGRKLTQTGQLTMSDARQLLALLETGDEIDEVVGAQVFHTRSSAELPNLAFVLAWAKAAGLLRIVGGRLVPVKKNQRLLDQPTALWAALFAAFDQLGPVLCRSRYFPSLLGENFVDGIAVLFASIAEGGGAGNLADIQEHVWSTLAVRYNLDDATEEQLGRLRNVTARDLRHSVDQLIALGALAEDDANDGRLRLTPLAEQTLRARYGPVTPGDPIAQLKITLLDTDPPVWRRLLVPAAIRLDRLDRVLQAAMGWTNSHLHMFTHPTGQYGDPDPDFNLPLHDERKATLRNLAERDGDAFGYQYDFGDSWDHEVLLEKLVLAEPGGRYPLCLDGARACPPEDCGGTPGYEDLIEALADPNHPEHDDLVYWLGIEKGADFDPAFFNLADANRRLDTVLYAATRTG